VVQRHQGWTASLGQLNLAVARRNVLRKSKKKGIVVKMDNKKIRLSPKGRNPEGTKKNSCWIFLYISYILFFANQLILV
jgi:hypothetical protein